MRRTPASPCAASSLGAELDFLLGASSGATCELLDEGGHPSGSLNLGGVSFAPGLTEATPFV